MNISSTFTFDEFLNSDSNDLADKPITLTILDTDTRLKFPTSFTRDKNKVIFSLEFKRGLNKFIVYDKDGDENEAISLEITKLYSEKHPEFIPKIDPVPRNKAPNQKTKEQRNADREKEISIAKEKQQEAIERARSQLKATQEMLKEAKTKFEEEKERSKTQLILCDKEIFLVDFLKSSPEELEEGKIICIEDMPKKFNVIPEENKQDFILLMDKLHFFSSVKLERDYLNKIIGLKIAILDKGGKVNEELSKKLTQMYIGFQRRMAEMKEKGVSIKQGSKIVLESEKESYIPKIKEKASIKLTERIYEKDDTPEIRKIKDKLYEAMDKLLLLNKTGAEPIIPFKEGYTSIHFLDDSLLKIIPFEHLKKIGIYYYADNDVIEFSKTLVNESIRDFDPSYKIKNDIDIQIIKQEIIRRHFFEIKIQELKKAYLTNLEANAATEYLNRIQQGNSLEEILSSVRNEIGKTSDKSKQKTLKILFSKASLWHENKSELDNSLNQSLLDKNDIYLVEHDSERVKEENDMSQEDSIYPPNREVDSNIFTTDKAVQYRLHYHLNALPANFKDEYSLEFVSDEALANLLIDAERFNKETMSIKCYRAQIDTELGCKRPYTLYQIWRAIRNTPYTEIVIPATKYSKEEIKASPRKAFEDGLIAHYENTLLDPIKKIIESQTIQEKKTVNDTISFLEEQISSQKKQELLKKQNDENKLKIEYETNAVYNLEFNKYQSYENKKNAFDYLIFTDTEMRDHLNSRPNTTYIFCPYCAKKISERFGKPTRQGEDSSEEVDCKYIYAGKMKEYSSNHRHECIRTRELLLSDRYVTAQENCRLPVGENYKTTLRDICTVCNGPVAFHDHYNLDSGVAMGTISLDLCFKRVDRTTKGILNASCLNEGGGGVLEAVARQLAYRDYAKEKMLANPAGEDNRFEMKFQEMAVLADTYAKIIRSKIKTKRFRELYFDTNLLLATLRFDSLAPRIDIKHDDVNNVFERAVVALRNSQWEEGFFDIYDRITDPLERKPTKFLFNPVPKPNREEIKAQIIKKYPSTSSGNKKGSTVPPKKEITTTNSNVVAIQSQLEEYIIQKSALEEELRKIKENPTTSMWEDAQQIADIDKTLQEIDREIASLQARLPKPSTRGGSFRRRTLKRKTRILTN